MKEKEYYVLLQMICLIRDLLIMSLLRVISHQSSVAIITRPELTRSRTIIIVLYSRYLL